MKLSYLPLAAALVSVTLGCEPEPRLEDKPAEQEPKPGAKPATVRRAETIDPEEIGTDVCGAEARVDDPTVGDDATPEPTAEDATAFVERLGGHVIRDAKRPGRPVVEVLLAYTKLTDAGLEELAPLKSATTLDLTGTLVTDAGLKGLAVFTNLQKLYLMNNPVTGSGLKELRPLKNLTPLHLDHNHVTDAGVKELAALTTLTSLTLRDRGGITDAGLKELAALKNLTTLRLGCSDPTLSKVTAAGLKELAPLKHLTTLSLTGTRMTDEWFKELAALQSLRTLHFLCEGTGVGLKELAPLKNLTTLSGISFHS
jgi:internalin A